MVPRKQGPACPPLAGLPSPTPAVQPCSPTTAPCWRCTYTLAPFSLIDSHPLALTEFSRHLPPSPKNGSPRWRIRLQSQRARTTRLRTDVVMSCASSVSPPVLVDSSSKNSMLSVSTATGASPLAGMRDSDEPTHGAARGGRLLLAFAGSFPSVVLFFL